jgi:hypothetical protein
MCCSSRLRWKAETAPRPEATNMIEEENFMMFASLLDGGSMDKR